MSATANKATAVLAIGQRMEDGTIYAGVSPDTGKPMYTTPKDTGLFATWRKAMDHAAKLDAHGHKDWRVPTKAELNVLFTNRAAISNLAETRYSSSTHSNVDYIAWAQRFSDGRRSIINRDDLSSLRCVRG